MSRNILGLPSSDKYIDAGQDLGSIRRKTFIKYPNRGMSLTGIISLLQGESLSHVTLSWFEDYFRYLGSTTRGTNPITKTAPSTGDADDGTVADAASLGNIATSNYIKVNSVLDYRIGQIVAFDPSGTNAQFRVTAVTIGVADAEAKGYLTVTPVRALASYSASLYAAGANVNVIATAYGQGSTATSPLGTKIPLEIKNTVQILRTPMRFTREQMKTPMRFDKSGPYKLAGREKLIEHYCSMENCLLFGQRSGARRTVLNSKDSSNDVDGKEMVYTMSGILEYLKLYDAGSTGLTINGSTYAPYYHKSAVTDDADEAKRYITNSDGLMSYDRLEDWVGRANDIGARSSPERLAICGQNVIKAINKMARNESTQIISNKDSVYGMNITTISMSTGDVHFTTHPLFNKQFGMENAMFICDPSNMMIRDMCKTELRTDIQDKKSLLKEDEFLSEFSLEFRSVESNVFVKNAGTYSASAAY